MSKIAKSISTGIVSAASYKYIAGAETSRAVLLGGITGASVFGTDVVLGFVPALPSMFSFLGTYTMDGVSSLISAVLTTLFLSYKSEESLSIGTNLKAFVKHFLYALGSTVAELTSLQWLVELLECKSSNTNLNINN